MTSPFASFVAVTALAAAAAPAWAQDGGAPPRADPIGDYRWAVYTACTVAFAAITAFLLVTHARSRRAADELASLERRLDALENAPPGRPAA